MGASSGSRSRVLQVITDNDRRGGQVFAADLHAALARNGVDVRTVALAPASSSSGLPFDSLGPTRRHGSTFRNLRREIKGSSLVIGHGSTTLPLCSLMAIGTGTPFVYRQISDQLFWANTLARRLRVRAALRGATRIVALWAGAAEVLSDHFGAPPDRVTVIPNGVPAERCLPVTAQQKSEAKHRFGLSEEAPTLLSLGALVPEKGVDTIIKAMGEPVAAAWQLLVVGAGPEEATLRRLSEAIAPGRVTFNKPVASGAEAMAAADVMLLTSRGGDSMPAVLIEAGMMGVPVVGTPIQGMVEIIKTGETGQLVPVDDPAATAEAVAVCLSEAQRYGPAAREWCLGNFEIDTVAEQWLAVIRSIVEAR